MKRQSGFTLLEILLVMFLLAGVASVVVLTLPDSGQAQLKRRADTLALQLDKISDEALIDGKTYGLFIAENSYTFMVLAKAGWQPLSEKPIKLASDSVLTLEKVEGDFVIKPNASNQTSEPTNRAAHKGLSERAKQPTPQIYFWPDGTITPFTVVLSRNGQQYRLTVNGLGAVETTATNATTNTTEVRP